MNTGIDLFIADLPGFDYGYSEEFGYGVGNFKSHCEDNGGVFTTPSSQSEVDAILQVKDIDSSCQYMIIAAYGAGDYPDDLTFFTDDGSQAQELTYANWGPGYPLIKTKTNPEFDNRCTYMDIRSGYDGVWYNENCDQVYQCGLCRASPSGGGGGGKLAFLPT